MITDRDVQLLRGAIEYAVGEGAGCVRMTLSRSTEDLISTLDGEIDRITHCEDTSLAMALFVDGRFGSFSTNKISENALHTFIRRCISITRMLAPDEFRRLPDRQRCCQDAMSGNELGLLDPAYNTITAEARRQTTLDACVYPYEGKGWKVISEEGEYSDSVYDTLVMDSEGLCCKHSENSFDYGVEVTIQAGEDRYSSYWWDSSTRHGGIDCKACSEKAMFKAASQIGSDIVKGGRYNMVVDSEMASRLVSPLLAALNGSAIQQKNSFLIDTLGKKMFHDGFTMVDDPHIPGQACSKLFDSEGVATRKAPIIEAGTVKQYFINTYMSGKLGMEPTSECATRPKIEAWPKAGLDRDGIMHMCGNGILVTDFNGGNSNSATGDFSYGIEGFLFEDGKIVRPVSGMLVTGNFITLWNNLIAAGSDARPCMSKLIPTLAFANVDFNGE